MTDETASRSSSLGMVEDARKNSLPPSREDSPAPLAVSLIGFMGAGKTTVGRALAARLGWRFEDLDDVIQARAGRSIEQIFQQQGEPAFRDLERTTVREILTAAKSAPFVLALGGGAFIEQQVQETLRDAEIPAVFLDAEVEELFRRSEQPDVVRPLRHDHNHFCQLYERRRPVYLKAQLRIETGGKVVAAVVEEIILGLGLVPKPDPKPGVSD
jgi:shikimate kinase